MGVVRVWCIETVKCWDLGSLCWLEDTEKIRTDEYDRFDASAAVDQVVSQEDDGNLYMQNPRLSFRTKRTRSIPVVSLHIERKGPKARAIQ
jgi:hypothetical protein